MPKGKKKGKGSGDTNAWMTTYTDLMILLLTFFVLLLSMSIVTDDKRLVALNSLTGAFGFKPGGHSIIGSPEGVNITLGSSPMREENIDFEKMRNLIMKNSLDPAVQAITDMERTIIRIDDKVLFEHGSSKINPERSAFLKEVGESLKDGPRTIEFRGYCATSETVFESNPLKAAMMLSAKRASAVFKFFRDECGIPPKRMVAHGFGTNVVRKGDVKHKNKMSRQVEIVLDYREPVPYRLREVKKDTLLDFKGFLFKVPGKANEP